MRPDQNEGLEVCLPTQQEGPFSSLSKGATSWYQQVGTDQTQSIRQIWGRRILRTNPKFRSISAVQTNSISISSKQLKEGVKSTCLLETYVHDCKLICIWGKDSESSPIPGHFTYFISSWLPSVTAL